MSELSTSARTAGVLGRAGLYRGLLIMAGKNFLWPVLIIFSSAVVSLSFYVFSLTIHAEDAGPSTTTAGNFADASTTSTSSNVDEVLAPEPPPLAYTLNARLAASRTFFDVVTPADVLILMAEQGPEESPEEFWARYQRLPHELQGVLIIGSGEESGSHLHSFAPQKFSDVLSAKSFCSSVPELTACDLRQIS